MRNPSKMAVELIIVATLSLLVSMSAFADRRHQPGTWRDTQPRLQNRSSEFRENERVTFEGRVTSLREERDGYRVHLDRGRHAFWVPVSRARNYGRDLRTGAFVAFGGVFRSGVIYVDHIGDGYDYNRRDRYDRRTDRVYGVVEDVNHRRELIRLRDRDTGRRIRVDADRLDRRSRTDLRHLRRGDVVVVIGEWDGREFEARRIEELRRW